MVPSKRVPTNVEQYLWEKQRYILFKLINLQESSLNWFFLKFVPITELIFRFDLFQKNCIT